MHASIAFCVMMVGGIMLQTDIAVAPLKTDDLAKQAALADQYPGQTSDLPRIAWVGQMEPGAGTSEQNQKPKAKSESRAQVAKVRRLPVAPTDPAATYVIQPGGAPNQASGYVDDNRARSRPLYGPQGAQFAQGATASPSTATYPPSTGYPGSYPTNAGDSNIVGYGRPAGYGQTPMPATIGGYAPPSSQGTSFQGSPYNTPTGGIVKPFEGYRPPSGYSPWNNLYLSTANGTVNTYTAYVKPMTQQQDVNMRTNDQINNVETLQSMYGIGGPGAQQAPLVDPAGFQGSGYGIPGVQVPGSNAGILNQNYRYGYPGN